MPRAKIDPLIHFFRHSDFVEMVNAFLVDREARGLSPHTIGFCRDELRYLRMHLEEQGVRDVMAVYADHLRRYLLALKEHRNLGGVHAAYRAMKVFPLVRSGDGARRLENPTARMKPPKVPVEPLTPISVPNLRAMVDTCERKTFAGDRDRAILLALFDTGGRASEFSAMNVGAVNLSTGTVMARAGKRGKFRTVLAGAKARREILRYLKRRDAPRAEDPLWVTQEGGRLTCSGLRANPAPSRGASRAAGTRSPQVPSSLRAGLPAEWGEPHQPAPTSSLGCSLA